MQTADFLCKRHFVCKATCCETHAIDLVLTGLLMPDQEEIETIQQQPAFCAKKRGDHRG